MIYCVRFITSRFTVSNETLCQIYTEMSMYDGSVYGRSASYGYRPVFLLSPNVKIKGGDGTKDDPYELEL